VFLASTWATGALRDCPADLEGGVLVPLLGRYSSDNALDELPVAVAAGHDRCSHGTIGACSVRKQPASAMAPAGPFS
jgi:hypothetical protein